MCQIMTVFLLNQSAYSEVAEAEDKVTGKF